MSRPTAAALVLADGTVFEGEHIGATPADGAATGEVVFNTVLTGYQEVLTDPSYAGQIITFTYPHIGNYGWNRTDMERSVIHARGVIVRDLARRHSNFRSEGHLDELLRQHGIPGIGGIDTRRLTKILRDRGAIGGAFGPVEGEGAVDEATLRARAEAEPGTDGIDLVAEVTVDEAYTVAQTGGSRERRIVAYDFGIKTTMVRQLAGLATVEVVPASTSAADVLARDPDAIFLSNGPGDPGMVPYAAEAIRGLLGERPIMGICLGHQLLSLAIGAEIDKLPFGHHGGNHPVQDLVTGKVEITAQNHNFSVVTDTLAPNAEPTHINLNDRDCEGMRVKGAPAFSVQYHPEAGPGPHDSRYLFDRFADQIDAFRAPATGGTR